MMKRTPALLLFFWLLSATGLHPAGKLDVSRLYGTWRLLYQGGYGYTFRFQKNYQSSCVIHLNTSAVIFKGIYTAEGDDAIRIQIYEMKNDVNAISPSFGSGFTKTSSTHFIFRASLSGTPKTPVLVLWPTRTVIDRRFSEGYFEPEIRLMRLP